MPPRFLALLCCLAIGCTDHDLADDDAVVGDLDWDAHTEWWLPGAFDPATSPNSDCDDRDEAVYPGSGC